MDLVRTATTTAQAGIAPNLTHAQQAAPAVQIAVKLLLQLIGTTRVQPTRSLAGRYLCETSTTRLHPNQSVRISNPSARLNPTLNSSRNVGSASSHTTTCAQQNGPNPSLTRTISSETAPSTCISLYQRTPIRRNDATATRIKARCLCS